MTSFEMKPLLAAMALGLSTLSAQAEMQLTVPPGLESQVLVGATAERTMNIIFTDGFSFASGGLHLTFDTGLIFQPGLSTIDFGSLFSGTFTQVRTALNGLAAPDGGGCGATLMYSYCASFDNPGKVDLSVTLPDPALMPTPDPFEMNGKTASLKLVFLGNQVGSYTVSYALDAVANDFLQAPTFEGEFNLINVTAVPEPATYALLLGGLAAIGALARRRARQA